MNHKALFWERKNKKVQCLLCPHLCLIEENKVGKCNVRKNIRGNLIALNYSKISSIALDPIEKKPLYHFKPGKYILSIGSYGCNMKCIYCQNYLISQRKSIINKIKIDNLYELIKKFDNNIGIAFTYNEPIISYEFIYDTIIDLKTKHPEIKVVLVTNGFINPKPLENILPFIDAFNIDLKAFSNDFYENICKAKLTPVLKTIESVYDKSHLEVTTLMVTDENDSIKEIGKIAEYLSNLSKNIPLHLTRYYPNYKMKQPPTDINQMYLAKEEAERFLNYVYLGNIPNDNNTYCPKCKVLVYDRKHFKAYLKDNKCLNCGELIPIVL